MKRPQLPLSNSPSLRPENNLSAYEESAIAIANLFRDLGAIAVAWSILCKGSQSVEELRSNAEEGIERVEGLLGEIDEEARKL